MNPAMRYHMLRTPHDMETIPMSSKASRNSK